MLLGRNIIGLPSNLSGPAERPFLRPRRSISRASIVAGHGISPKSANGPTNSTPTPPPPPHSLLWGKVQTKLLRRRRELSSPDASTTLRLLKLLLAHLLWRVCSSPMATLPLYFLIQEHRIHLSVLLS